jgi:hypothetical protein
LDPFNLTPKRRLFLGGFTAGIAELLTGARRSLPSARGLRARGDEEEEPAPPAVVESLPGFTISLLEPDEATPTVDNVDDDMPDVFFGSLASSPLLDCEVCPLLLPLVDPVVGTASQFKFRG